MKKNALFLPVLVLVLGFFATTQAKMLFITLPSLQQAEITEHKNHCTYYALHAAATAVNFFNSGKIPAIQADRVAALQGLVSDRTSFSETLPFWEDVVRSCRALWTLGSTHVDLVSMYEVNNALIKSDNSLVALQNRGQLACLNVTRTVDASRTLLAEDEKSSVLQMQRSIAAFRAGLAVGILFCVPNCFFKVGAERYHSIAVTIVPVGDDVEIYYTNSASADLLPQFRKEVVQVVKFMLRGDVDLFHSYWGVKDSLRAACASVPSDEVRMLIAMRKRCAVTLDRLQDEGGRDFLRWALGEQCREVLAPLGARISLDTPSGALSLDGPSTALSGHYPTSLWQFFTQAPLRIDSPTSCLSSCGDGSCASAPSKVARPGEEDDAPDQQQKVRRLEGKSKDEVAE